jgi:tRNA threonylcarbamoyladenosine biosynthesis protein TsaB
MITLALDTTTHGGSVAVSRDGRVLAEHGGPAEVPHARRLPGELVTTLAAARVPLEAVTLFAVACGPGAFTGLRIGIATMQGLSFAWRRPIVGVSALDALAHAALLEGAGTPLLAACMDAARGEIFTALYAREEGGGLTPLEGAAVGSPSAVVARWSPLAAGRPLTIVGDGALRYRDSFTGAAVAVHRTVPRIAPLIARLGEAAAARGLAGPPHAVQPLYVRRPDAEIARDRVADAAARGCAG